MPPGILPPSKAPNSTLAATEWNNSVRINWQRGPLGIATALGDLFVGVGANEIKRLAKGNNGDQLTVAAGDLAWTSPLERVAVQTSSLGGFEDNAPETEEQAGNNVVCSLPAGWEGMWVATDVHVYWRMVANRATYGVYARGTINVTNDEDGPLWVSTHAVDQSQVDRRMTGLVQHLMFTDQPITFQLRHQIFDGSTGDAQFNGYYWRFLKFRTF